ncbi:MAG: adenylate kinase [Methanomassiliicoccales archaeon]
MDLKIVLLGPPGSGKGTQAERLTRELGLAHISTGDLLREAVKSGSELGSKAKSYMDAGELVPDDLVIEMVGEKIRGLDDGYVLDGFPRNLEQARDLERITEVDAVVDLRVDEEELVDRLSKRRTCDSCGAVYHLRFNPPEREGKCDRCGGQLYQREDDSEGTIRERLRVYRENTLPLVEYYREKGVLIDVDGARGIDEVFQEIIDRLKERD